MQVNSSVNIRYYTLYQSNTNVKYCTGITKTEEGKRTPSETTENPGFTEFVDYREFHKAWMSQNSGKKVDCCFETACNAISFEELGEDRVGAMRLYHGINQIVTAKNPEDGKEYLTYFTDKSIVCRNGEDGTTVWTMSITESQAESVKEYFEGYKANHGEELKWYSDEALGLVSSKEFWMGFFEGASIGDASEAVQEPADVLLEEFLDRFDSIEEAIRELMKEEQEKKAAEEAKIDAMAAYEQLKAANRTY
ncbi:MAG: hypothetical protein IJW37_06720 [Lachnospiraceae bacterium]|nr:hypothetical protein [Lachnospiraceae bacterium]